MDRSSSRPSRWRRCPVEEGRTRANRAGSLDPEDLRQPLRYFNLNAQPRNNAAAPRTRSLRPSRPFPSEEPMSVGRLGPWLARQPTFVQTGCTPAGLRPRNARYGHPRASVMVSWRSPAVGGTAEAPQPPEGAEGPHRGVSPPPGPPGAPPALPVPEGRWIMGSGLAAPGCSWWPRSGDVPSLQPSRARRRCPV